MRPTNLCFKSPREVCQAPPYNPPITNKGSTLAYAPPVKKRSRSNHTARFPIDQLCNHTSVIVGPGRYRDDQKSILNSVKTKLVSKQKRDVIDSKSSAYTLVGDSKVLDLAFLSPKIKKQLNPFVMTASIDLSNPKLFANASPDPLASHSLTFSLAPGSKTSSREGTVKISSTHQRTSSLQTVSGSTGNKTPWDKVLSSSSFMTIDHRRKGTKDLTKIQKQRNDSIYNQLIEAQLSPELKLLKKELEDFQKKLTHNNPNLLSTKMTFAEDNDTILRRSQDEETEMGRGSEKQSHEGQIGNNHRVEKQKDNDTERDGDHENEKDSTKESGSELPGILTESSRNFLNFKSPEIIFSKDEICTTLSSPKFLCSENIPQLKESVRASAQKASTNKAMSSKRPLVNITNSLNPKSLYNMSYGINTNKGKCDYKAPRKI